MSKPKKEMKMGWKRYVHSTVNSIHLCDTTGQCGLVPAIFTVSQLCCILFGSTPWIGNSTVARPLPKNNKTKTWHTWIHVETEFQTTIPSLEWQKALQSHASPTTLPIIIVSVLKRHIKVNEISKSQKYTFQFQYLKCNSQKFEKLYA